MRMFQRLQLYSLILFHTLFRFRYDHKLFLSTDPKHCLPGDRSPPGNDARVITRMPPLPVQALGNQQWADAHPAALVHADGCCDGCSTRGKILKHSVQSVGFNTHMHVRMHAHTGKPTMATHLSLFHTEKSNRGGMVVHTLTHESEAEGPWVSYCGLQS